MIVPDVNLLVYAYNADMPHHAAARAWFERIMTDEHPIGFPWASVMGFVRIMTNRSAVVQPITSDEACGVVRTWLEREHAQILDPGPRHLELFQGMLAAAHGAGNLTTDAHLAAIAVEYQAELCSNDRDFGRFPGLRWSNPLKD